MDEPRNFYVVREHGGRTKQLVPFSLKQSYHRFLPPPMFLFHSRVFPSSALDNFSNRPFEHRYPNGTRLPNDRCVSAIVFL